MKNKTSRLIVMFLILVGMIGGVFSPNLLANINQNNESSSSDTVEVTYEVNGVFLNSLQVSSGSVSGLCDSCPSVAAMVNVYAVVNGARQDMPITSIWVPCKPWCGNGCVEAGEICDDGNQNNDDDCKNNCTPQSCGNGTINSQEECDPGSSPGSTPVYDTNNSSFSSCSQSTCTCTEECKVKKCSDYSAINFDDINDSECYKVKDLGDDAPAGLVCYETVERYATTCADGSAIQFGECTGGCSYDKNYEETCPSGYSAAVALPTAKVGKCCLCGSTITPPSAENADITGYQSCDVSNTSSTHRMTCKTKQYACSGTITVPESGVVSNIESGDVIISSGGACYGKCDLCQCEGSVGGASCSSSATPSSPGSS